MDFISQLGPILGLILTIILTVVGIVSPSEENGEGGSSSHPDFNQTAPAIPETPEAPIDVAPGSYRHKAEFERLLGLKKTSREVSYLNSLSKADRNQNIVNALKKFYGDSTSSRSTSEGWFYDNPRNVDPRTRSNKYRIHQGAKIDIRYRKNADPSSIRTFSCTAGYVDAQEGSVYLAQHCVDHEPGYTMYGIYLNTPNYGRKLIASPSDVSSASITAEEDEDVAVNDLAKVRITGKSVVAGENRFSGDEIAAHPVQVGDLLCALVEHGETVSCGEVPYAKDNSIYQSMAAFIAEPASIKGDSGGPMWIVDRETGATKMLAVISGTTAYYGHDRNDPESRALINRGAYLYQGTAPKPAQKDFGVNRMIFSRALHMR